MKPRRLVEIGQLGRFPADEGASGFLAAVGNTLDHIRRHLEIQLAHGQIIKEKQWAGSLNRDVVHAHGHQIDADRRPPAADPVAPGTLGKHACGECQRERAIHRGDRQRHVRGQAPARDEGGARPGERRDDEERGQVDEKAHSRSPSSPGASRVVMAVAL